MISSGYFTVSKTRLEKLGKAKGLEFLSEMANYGGRISHDNITYWITEMGWKDATLIETEVK